MAAATVYSSLFNSDGTPKKVWNPPFGAMGSISIRDTVATTTLDDTGDFLALIPVANGTVMTELTVANGDLDTDGSPALDADIIMRAIDSAGTATDTILYNAGAAFQAAVTTARVIPLVADDDVGGIEATGGAEGYVLIGFYVNTAAATGASTTLDLVLKGR